MHYFINVMVGNEYIVFLMILAVYSENFTTGPKNIQEVLSEMKRNER